MWFIANLTITIITYCYEVQVMNKVSQDHMVSSSIQAQRALRDEDTIFGRIHTCITITSLYCMSI